MPPPRESLDSDVLGAEDGGSREGAHGLDIEEVSSDDDDPDI